MFQELYDQIFYQWNIWTFHWADNKPWRDKYPNRLAGFLKSVQRLKISKDVWILKIKFNFLTVTSSVQARANWSRSWKFSPMYLTCSSTLNFVRMLSIGLQGPAQLRYISTTVRWLCSTHCTSGEQCNCTVLKSSWYHYRVLHQLHPAVLVTHAADLYLGLLTHGPHFPAPLSLHTAVRGKDYCFRDFLK